jgi:tRNA nucleotidyltransferase (CCA-adding enzyme)
MNPEKGKTESASDHPGSGGRWEHFHHESDVGIRGIGPTPAAAFEQAARAMTAVITDLKEVHPTHKLNITCQAPDLELLFADWLNALVYEMAIRRMLFSQFEVELSDSKSLSATVRGEAVERERHQPVVEIKAATYAELSVRQSSEDEWVAQCIVDV